jgi:hypothetical protein
MATQWTYRRRRHKCSQAMMPDPDGSNMIGTWLGAEDPAIALGYDGICQADAG